MKRLSLILVLPAVVLAACGQLQTYTGIRPAPVTTEECGINHLMMDLHDTHSMNEEQVQRTLGTWEEEFKADPSNNRRLKLALLYAAGNESVRDPGRAQELLSDAAGALVNPGDREFAVMVRQFLDEQIAASKKINSLNKQIADQNKRILELEQQQKALMNIEQKIQQRDTPAVIDDGR